ncbi:MAG: hypothetical protein LUD72_03935 [Bacteroidales bacterium]|nr:hypothetical protein [Bacteroidales bacterium]
MAKAPKNNDEGHRLTDLELGKLERKIAQVYSDAADEMQETVDEYFDSFTVRDAEQKKLLDAGEITARQYASWRLAQIGRGDRYKAMQSQLAERYTRANELAVDYVNDAMPGIYALNANYAAYTIEHAGAYVDFTLVNEETVRQLITTDPDLMPYYPPERAIDRGIDLAYGREQITASVTSSILQGKSLGAISDDLQNRMQTMSRSSAIRTARTATTAAENAGRQETFSEAQEMGIKCRKQWVATLDDRTRETHQQADGQIVGVDDTFSVGDDELMYPGDPSGSPEEIYNCFIGETLCATDSDIERSYNHCYEGKLVTVYTASGIEFTCTPNHPILTPNGWIGAGRLHDGDDLLVTFIGDGKVSGWNPNIKHVFSSMSACHKFFDKVFSERTSILGVNFHGDVAASDVEIIAKKGLLRDNGDPRICEGSNEFLLEHSDKPFVCKRTFMKHFRRIGPPTLGVMGRCCESLAFFWRRLSHANIHGFRPSTNRDVVLSEYTINNLPAETEIRGNLLDGLSGKVFIDKIVRIEISTSKCHVYNLQTENGYYFVSNSLSQRGKRYNGNMIIAKNCRCTVINILDGIDTTMERWARDPETGEREYVTDMTYSEWIKSKGG